MQSSDSRTAIPKLWVWIFMGILGLILIYIAIVDDTTNGAGDTISHYMFSRYSWEHPHYFLDHWAKPVFTLISSPFSQFGFAGMRVFNVLMAMGTGICIWQIAILLKRPFPSFVILLLFAMPFFGLKMYSGLTEFLYAFLLSLSIWLSLKKRYWQAAILVSFFPFCRSEGIIAVGMFILLLVWIRQWKIIPLLVVGHVFYEVWGGLFFEKPFGWTWTKIPYFSGSGYGSGSWSDMLNGLVYICEFPVIIMLIIAILFKGISTLPSIKSMNHEAKIDILLVYGNAVAFFVAHTIFWVYGLFNSAGLIRVFLAIMPLLALIALDSFRVIEGALSSSKLKVYLPYIIILAVSYHAFNTSRSGLVYKKGANRVPEHETLKDELFPYLTKNYEDRPTFYNIGYLAILRNENYYGQDIAGTWFRKADLENIPIGGIYIWDSKFATSVGSIQQNELQADPRFEEQRCFVSDTWNGKYTYCVFEKIAF